MEGMDLCKYTHKAALPTDMVIDTKFKFIESLLHS